MRRLVIYCIVILWLCAQPSLCTSKPIGSHFTVKDGLLNSTVYGAMQDKRGFLWFFTETGVNRFDGDKFESYTIKNGLADNEIFGGFEDSSRRIWFLSYNGKLSYYKAGKIYNAKNEPSLHYPAQSGFLLSAQIDRSGIIWLSTSSGDILKVIGKGVQVIKSPFGQKNHNASFITAHLLKGKTGVFKFALDDSTKTIYRFDLGTRQLKYLGHHDNILLQATPLQYPITGNNIHLFINNNTIVKFDGATNKFQALHNEQYNLAKILCVYADKKDIWIGTAGEGIVKTDIASQQTSERLLENEVVTSILKDREGNIWVTTHGNGIYCFKKRFDNIAAISSHPSYGIGLAYFDGRKYLMSGGDRGDVNVYEGNNVIHSFPLSARQFNRVHDITYCGNGKVLIGSDISASSTYNLKSGASSKIHVGYRGSSYSPKGTLWLCSADAIYRFEDDKFINSVIIDKGYKATCIAALNDQTIYLGTTTKLLKYTTGKKAPTVVLGDSVLETGIIATTFCNDKLWVATHGNGLFVVKNDNVIKHLTATTDNLTSDVIQGLFDDKMRFLWVATNSGISVLERNTGRLIRNLTINDGLSTNDIKDIVADSEKVYVSTPEGINALNIDIVDRRTEPANLFFTSITFNGDTTIDPPDSIAWKYAEGFMNVNFSAISFDDKDQMRYEYRLAPNGDWQQTLAPTITLFSLSPGTYSLQVRARNIDAQHSPIRTLSITILPLWYQMYQFKLLMLFATIAAILLLFKQRIKRIRNKALEHNLMLQHTLSLESKSLAYQMNPHFIFNSLNTIQHFILSKPELETLNYLNDFSLLMRQILENSKKNYISLKEDIDFIKRYLDLEQIRYDNSFRYLINLENISDPEELGIPPILIQPIVENALKHGLADCSDGVITITFYLNGSILKVVVSDNGKGFHQISTTIHGRKRESTALHVLEERLKLMQNKAGQNGSLYINALHPENVNRPGTVVSIEIPLNNQPWNSKQ